MMDRIALVAVLTAVIHFTDTLFYAVRYSGVKTRRLITAFSLYQILSLLAMVANMCQAPLLSAAVEQGLNTGFPDYHTYLQQLEGSIRFIILAASGGTLAAAALSPFAIFLFNRAVFLFERVGPLTFFLYFLLFPGRFFKVLRESTRIFSECRKPHWLAGKNIFQSQRFTADRFIGPSPLPVWLLAIQVLIVGIWTTGVLSALYAGALLPSFRSTASLLSGVVNGFATALSAFLIDPVTAVITDQALCGGRSEKEFAWLSFWLVLCRLLGTLIAQLLFLPAAYLVKFAALLITQAPF